MADDGSIEKPEVVTSQDLILQGNEIVKQSASLVSDVKSSEATKQLLDEGKKFISGVKEKEEVQKLISEGQKLLGELKTHEKGAELIEEGRQLLNEVKSKEQFKNIKQQLALLAESAVRFVVEDE